MPRTLAQYLESHGGDHAAALDEAVRDVAARESENGAARTFRRTFEPVLRDLNIPFTQEGAESLRTSLEGVESLSDLQEALQGTTEVLEALGINFDADEATLSAQLDALPQRWQDAQTAMTERDTLREAEQGRTLAEASGANPDVLSDRLKAAGLKAEVKDIPAEGANPARKEVRVLDKDGKDQGELKSYAQQHWPAYVPALFQATQQAQQAGTVITPQAGTGGAVASANPVEARIQARIDAAQKGAS